MLFGWCMPCLFMLFCECMVLLLGGGLCFAGLLCMVLAGLLLFALFAGLLCIAFAGLFCVVFAGLPCIVFAAWLLPRVGIFAAVCLSAVVTGAKFCGLLVLLN